jgi:hypothetical protein
MIQLLPALDVSSAVSIPLSELKSIRALLWIVLWLKKME